MAQSLCIVKSFLTFATAIPSNPILDTYEVRDYRRKFSWINDYSRRFPTKRSWLEFCLAHGFPFYSEFNLRSVFFFYLPQDFCFLFCQRGKEQVAEAGQAFGECVSQNQRSKRKWREGGESIRNGYRGTSSRFPALAERDDVVDPTRSIYPRTLSSRRSFSPRLLTTWSRIRYPRFFTYGELVELIPSSLLPSPPSHRKNLGCPIFLESS